MPRYEVYKVFEYGSFTLGRHKDVKAALLNAESVAIETEKGSKVTVVCYDLDRLDHNAVYCVAIFGVGGARLF